MRQGVLKNVMMKLMSTKAAERFGLQAGGAIDVWLLTKTNGRVAMLVGWPIGLLETRGAKSGLVRRNALMYLQDEGRLLLVASKGGAPQHPAWLHNLRANPEVRFRWRGHDERLTAREASPEEHPTLWSRMLELYPGYAVYQERAGQRTIPVVILERHRE